MTTIRRTWYGLLNEQATTGDTLKDALRYRQGDRKKNLPLYYRAKQVWMNWQDFRDRRHKVRRYIHGDQMGDLVTVGNVTMTKRELFKKLTNTDPITSNYMIRYFTTLKGYYTKSFALPTCFAREENADVKAAILTNALHTNYDTNKMHHIFTQSFGELLRGGMPVLCEEWCRIASDLNEDTYTFEVNPDYVGIEYGGSDSQMRDITLFLEMRDYTPEDLATQLSNETGMPPTKAYEKVKQLYAAWLPFDYQPDLTQMTSRHKTVGWNTPARGMCRTYRVWTREKKVRIRCVDILDKEQPLFKVEKEDLPQIEAINRQRISDGLAAGMRMEDIITIETKEFWDSFYYLHVLTPDGDVLMEMENPYEHGELPYTVCPFEFVDGDIIPYLWNIIPHQDNYNKLLNQKSEMVERALKDLKMIPYDCVPPNMSPKQFAEQFKVIGGVVFFKPSKSGKMPQVISSNMQDIGINELLSIHKNAMEEITNVSEAMQGLRPENGTAASRYAMESENSTTAVSAMYNAFATFEEKVAEKKMKNILQFYTEPRDVVPSQSGGLADYTKYDPKVVGDVRYVCRITRGMNTPIARMAEDDTARELFQAGALTPEQRVQLGYVANAPKFQQVLRQNKEEQEQMQAQQP